MSLIGVETYVPGVSSNEGFVQWLAKNRIIAHPDLCIRRSDEGGIGLFLSKQLHSREKVELARIPELATFNLQTCLSLLRELKHSDTHLYNESDIIRDFLVATMPQTETEIIKSYFLSFKFLSNLLAKLGNLGKHDEFTTHLKNSPLRSVEPYLDILSSTEIDSIDKDDVELLNEFRGLYRSYRTLEANITKIIAENENEYPELIDFLNFKYSTILEGINIADLLTLEDFHQISSAVRSRILEIPADVGTDDVFVVNATLVPLLDFANHTTAPESKNAHFDIDRDTNDVILYFEDDSLDIESLNISETQRTSQEKHELIEVFISYSPIEDISKMFATYGFIPNDKGREKLFEIAIERDFLEMSSEFSGYGDKLCKWLHILPNIQFVFSDVNKPQINFDGNLFPLLFANLKYDNDWPMKILDTEGSDLTVDDEQIQNLREYELNIGDYIVGIPQVAVSVDVNGEPWYPENVTELLELIEPSKIDQLMKESVSYLRGYCKRRVSRLKEALDRSKDSRHCNILQLVEFEIGLLTNFCNEDNYDNDEVYDLEECQQEWIDYRYTPMINQIGDDEEDENDDDEFED